MKIVKFKPNTKYKYLRKVLIKNLILNISVGIHNFEKKKKQKVRFNIEILTDPDVKPNRKNMSSILNYETIINKISLLIHNKHYELLEELAENIFDIIFKFKLVKKATLKIEKIEIIKNSDSVGIKISKYKN
tara:strand:+ start:102 stop:497 length:396 start_codon:yes stop_codon:yes gene_type:complete